MLSSSDFSVERRKRVLILWFFRWLRGRQFWKFFPNVWMFGLTARSFVCRITRSWKNGDRHRGRSQFPFFHATSWSRREERGQTPRTESVPFPPWSRWMFCESDVDMGISRVISMFGNSVCCSKELSEGLATGWPIGQPLASPISFNHWGLEICGQDWPGWPRCHCFGVFGEAVLFVFLVSSRDAISTVRFLLSGDLRCHREDWSESPRPGTPGRALGCADELMILLVF